jgi:2-oxoglutarate ferredoxin oxidoreductase subunit gamma
MQQTNQDRYSVLMSGLGGQGLLTMGKVLTQAGCSRFRHVTYHPNYGPSMRGGECECTVTLSQEENTSISSRNPSAAILMGIGAWMLYESQIKSGGLLFVDSSIIPNQTERTDLTAYYIPATQMALELGSAMVSNLILLGAYLETSKALSRGNSQGEVHGNQRRASSSARSRGHQARCQVRNRCEEWRVVWDRKSFAPGQS